jgi:amino acid transporter
MGIAVAFYYLNKHDPNCGASYTWVGRSISPSLGFMNGWVILLTDLLFMVFAAPQCGNAILQLVNNAAVYGVGPINLQATDLTAATIVGALVMAGVTWMVVVGIQLAAKFQYFLLGMEYFIVVGMSIVGIFKKGDSGASFGWDWLSPFAFSSTSALASGVVVAVFLYWGWDTAANVNEESRNATENPGKAGMYGMVALLILFVLATVSVQLVLGPDAIVASSTGTLSLWADTMFDQPWASLAVIALITSTVATLQTTLLPSARTAFSMGRDGTLSRFWGSVSTKYKTPALATLIFGGLTVVIAFIDLKLDKLSSIISAGVLAIGILVAYYYGMTGLACAVYYRKLAFTSIKRFLLVFLIPLLSWAALWSLAGYLIWSDWTNSNGYDAPVGGDLIFNGNNLKFQVVVPVLVLLAGIPALVISRLLGKAEYFRLPRVIAPEDFPPTPATAPVTA